VAPFSFLWILLAH